MLLDTPANVVQAFYRLVGSTSGDAALAKQGESTNDVAYYFLTRGFRRGQRWLIDRGLGSWWRTRGAAITWSGTEASDGGRYTALPSDFLRLWGDRTRTKSALVEADGTEWGQEVDEEQSALQGDYYYLKNSNLWITRSATPPDQLYIEYYYQHPEFTASVTMDFPMEARPLGVALAADFAASDGWLPGGAAMIAKIEKAVENAEGEAKNVARQTRKARRFAEPYRVANNW